LMRPYAASMRVPRLFVPPLIYRDLPEGTEASRKIVGKS
jgi:hypothetical protein